MKKNFALGYTDSRVGTSGLEKQYEDILKATNSSYSIKYNSNGDPIVTNSINGQKGDNIRLSIDWELQTFADELITNELKACNSFNKYFEKMYFVMMDPNTGEVLVMSAKKLTKKLARSKIFLQVTFRSGRNWFYFKSGYIIYRI
ncbi:MAG: hypothetical protein ACLR43_02350 [Faecalibacillus faecis]